MKKRKPRLAAMIIDCLRLEQHMSHFGFPQAVATARRSGAKQTYLVSHFLPFVVSSRLVFRPFWRPIASEDVVSVVKIIREDS